MQWFFFNRIKNHLTSNKQHTLSELTDKLASCRPLYEVFDANRVLFCRHLIDPLNGLWFASFMCLSLWAMVTPIALGLASIYGRMCRLRTVSRSNSHQ